MSSEIHGRAEEDVGYYRLRERGSRAGNGIGPTTDAERGVTRLGERRSGPGSYSCVHYRRQREIRGEIIRLPVIDRTGRVENEDPRLATRERAVREGAIDRAVYGCPGRSPAMPLTSQPDQVAVGERESWWGNVTWSKGRYQQSRQYLCELDRNALPVATPDREIPVPTPLARHEPPGL